MHEKPIKIIIVNPSFWPKYHIISDALLRFAEELARRGLIKANVDGILKSDGINVKHGHVLRLVLF